MEYCITMERTLRVAVRFHAENDDQARERAIELYEMATPANFEHGDETHDYALSDSDGRTIVDWT